MKISKDKAKQNLEYAQRWLKRANKDFTLFKILVPFDKKTDKSVRCNDPALAIYLLQQSIEKAVKATAIASGQYIGKDFTSYYRHNSLGLILDLFTKSITRINRLGLDPESKMFGIDFIKGQSQLLAVENQVMGIIPLYDKTGKKVHFDSASRSVAPEVIDQILNMIISSRNLMLSVIKEVFDSLTSIGLPKLKLGANTKPQDILEKINESFKTNPSINPLSDVQLEGLLEFSTKVSDLTTKSTDIPKRQEVNINYLGVWALSLSLYFLTYLTYGHEATSRYPLKKKGDIKNGRLGCDDYDENLGIVNRLGKIGYVTSLTINDLKTGIDDIALFFAVE